MKRLGEAFAEKKDDQGEGETLLLTRLISKSLKTMAKAHDDRPRKFLQERTAKRLKVAEAEPETQVFFEDEPPPRQQEITDMILNFWPLVPL